MPPEAHYSFGDALEMCYDTALADWRRMYAASVSPQDLMAGPVVNVLVQTLLLPRGRANVTVTVNARKQSQTDVFFFIMQRDCNLWTFPNQELADPAR